MLNVPRDELERRLIQRWLDYPIALNVPRDKLYRRLIQLIQRWLDRRGCDSMDAAKRMDAARRKVDSNDMLNVTTVIEDSAPAEYTVDGTCL